MTKITIQCPYRLRFHWPNFSRGQHFVSSVPLSSPFPNRILSQVPVYQLLEVSADVDPLRLLVASIVANGLLGSPITKLLATGGHPYLYPAHPWLCCRPDQTFLHSSSLFFSHHSLQLPPSPKRSQLEAEIYSSCFSWNVASENLILVHVITSLYFYFLFFVVIPTEVDRILVEVQMMSLFWPSLFLLLLHLFFLSILFKTTEIF